MYGTSEEAKTMLEKAVAEMKTNKAMALDMFNKGEGGFKDRDLYVFCANASDGIMTAHPYGYKGQQLREILGRKGYPFGQEIMETATEGEIKEVSYWWERPGSEAQVKKTTYYTKVGDQICGVGYYQD
jgi:signal transduction histidine kinase